MKLSKTVEDILQLDVELLNPMQEDFGTPTALQVKFKGRRAQLDVNEDPALLEFEGICPLPE